MVSKKIKKIIIVLSFILSSVTIFFGVRFVTQQQEQAKKTGASGNVSLYFEPNEITADLNTAISPILMVNPYTDSVTAVELYLNFDSSKISIENIVNSSSFPTILKSLSIDNNSGQASITLGVTPNNQITSITEVISLSLRTNGVYGDVTIAVAQNSRVAALNNDTNVLSNYG